ncbi:22332_t:CDS:2 [Rhizophagus irregularis]|nr:22332_t:CDS:2 [Rhizophagus irregularis]
MKQEQPFLRVMRFSAFPWSYTFFGLSSVARITAHWLVSGYRICGKVQVQLEPALEYETGL